MGLDHVRVETWCSGHELGRSSENPLEDVYPERKIRRGEKRAIRPVHVAPDVVEMVVPAGGTYDDWTAGRDDRSNVRRSGIRNRKLDGDVGAVEHLLGETRPHFSVIETRYDLELMSGRELGDGAAHFPHAHNGQPSPHDAPPKNAACSRCIAGFTWSSSTTIVRLIPVALRDSMCTRTSPIASSARDMA